MKPGQHRIKQRNNAKLKRTAWTLSPQERVVNLEIVKNSNNKSRQPVDEKNDQNINLVEISTSSFVIAVQKKDKEQHVRFTSSANNSEEEQVLKQDK